MRQLIHSVTKDDFTIQTFCAGGKGGQNQNRRSTGVRVIHNDSGARGECREERHQAENKKRAFLRCVDSDKFKAWHKIAVAKAMGQRAESPEEIRARVDREVDAALQDGRISVEFIEAL